MVQWLELGALTAGAQVRFLVGEVRSRELRGTTEKMKKKKKRKKIIVSSCEYFINRLWSGLELQGTLTLVFVPNYLKRHLL